jgi:SIT4-associating protein SAP185/190
MALLNDNKGYDVVKERNELRNKMKEYDPISFKYNEVIILPNEESNTDNKSATLSDDDDFANDTIDSFNSKNDHDNGHDEDPDHDDSILHNQTYDQDLEEPHENANLTEEQLRAKPVIGDQWKIALYDNQIISNIVSMFFKFPWNNFLHNVVFDIVQQVLNGSMDIGFNKFLAIDLFDRADITNKIIYGQEYCTKFEEENNGLRLGYMGHLTLIAEEVVKFIQSYPTNTLSDVIDFKTSESEWENYVNNVLYDTREKYNAILGGADDEDVDDIDEQDDDHSAEIDDDEEHEELIRTGADGEDTAFFAFNDQPEEGYEEDQDQPGETFEAGSALNKKSISDEDESEDEDDNFSKYMTQELVNTASTEVSNSVGNKSSDDDVSSDEEEIKDASPSLSHHKHIVLPEDDDDIGEDYIDPNDDGKSYKKFNPLYDDTGALIAEKEAMERMEEDESSSSSDSDEEIYEPEDVDTAPKLTRAASKG